MAGFEAIETSRVSPWHLYGNSTSHTWLFSAIAELIGWLVSDLVGNLEDRFSHVVAQFHLSDNAYDPDVNASQLYIDKRIINGVECLNFVDNGNGMNADKLHKMLSFGYSDKKALGDHRPIGYYGNGFKSGSMRLGKDALVLTRTKASMSCGFLSQSFLERIKSDCVLVPIVTWSLPSKTIVSTESNKSSLRAILKYSIFTTEQELLDEFTGLEKCKTGTNIIIYNLRMDKTGKFELDFDSDPLDLLNPETPVVDLTSINRPIYAALPKYRKSLREYCSILYLKPRMKIFLRQKKVETKLISKSLSRTETDVYKPSWLNKKSVKIVFGFTSNTEPESYGLMMYYKNRLIKAFEKVGVQKQANDQGVGVVGVVETDFLNPIHNKQDFERTDKYSAFMQNVATKLNDYWHEKTYGKLQNPQEQNIPLPDWTWAQCDNCLKWRRLPTGYTEKLPEQWYCKLNPDAAFNRCDIEEEPEDDDEALQVSYTKTYKKQREREKRLAAQAQAEAEQQKMLQREREVQERERQIRELQRKNQELEVSSSTQARNGPMIWEHARNNLREYQNKLKEKESTIQRLNVQKQQLEQREKQLLEMVQDVQLSNSQNRLLVDKIAGSGNSTVTSSSSSRKRKTNTPEDAAGGKMFIKTEDGDMVEVTRMDDDDDNVVDLTLDEDEEEVSNNKVDIVSEKEGKSKTAETSKTTAETSKTTVETSKASENVEKSKEKDKSVKSDKPRADEKGDNRKDEAAESNKQVESGNSSASKTSDSKTEKKDSESETKTSKKKDSSSVGEEPDIKPDKAVLDKKMKDKETPQKKNEAAKENTDTSTEDKKQLQLKSSEVEKLKAELGKAKGELKETKEILTSLQENIFRLLKIIVPEILEPDYGYENPENVDKVILQLIRVNEEESQES